MRPLSKSRPRARPARRVRLILENGDISCVEANDRPRVAGLHFSDALAGALLRLPRDEWLPHSDPGGGELADGGWTLGVLARQGNSVADEVMATSDNRD